MRISSSLVSLAVAVAATALIAHSQRRAEPYASAALTPHHVAVSSSEVADLASSLGKIVGDVESDERYRLQHLLAGHSPEFEVVLPEDYLQDVLDNPAHPPRATVKPVLNGEKDVAGMWVKSAPAGSALARFGLVNDDRILATNGDWLNGPGNLSRTYRIIRNSKDLHFLIERQGKIRCLHVILED